MLAPSRNVFHVLSTLQSLSSYCVIIQMKVVLTGNELCRWRTTVLFRTSLIRTIVQCEQLIPLAGFKLQSIVCLYISLFAGSRFSHTREWSNPPPTARTCAPHWNESLFEGDFILTRAPSSVSMNIRGVYELVGTAGHKYKNIKTRRSSCVYAFVAAVMSRENMACISISERLWANQWERYALTCQPWPHWTSQRHNVTVSLRVRKLMLLSQPFSLAHKLFMFVLMLGSTGR